MTSKNDKELIHAKQCPKCKGHLTLRSREHIIKSWKIMQCEECGEYYKYE
jgi:uncharacterized protein YbaR (Trm112 family)